MTDNNEENGSHFEENQSENFQKKQNIKNEDIKEEEGFLEFLCKNKKSIITKLINIVLLIVAINISVFVSVWLQQCSNNKIHTKAKIYMSSAAVINIMYIYPVYKCIGWGNDFSNIIVSPFCIIRNFLYNQGLKNIPEDDGEREVWWFVIRFTEYDKFVIHTAYKMHTIHADSIGYRTYEKIKNFNDEVYEHILKLATLKIKDEHLRSRRYNQLAISIHRYHAGEGCAWLGGKANPNSFNTNTARMKKYKTLLDLFIKQTEYIKREEPEAYDYFKNHTYNYYLDDLILFTYSEELVTSELIKKNIIDYNKEFERRVTISNFNKMDCGNKYLKLMGEVRTKLQPEIEGHFLSENEKNYILNQIQPQWQDEIISKICPNNPHLKSSGDAFQVE